MAVGDTLRLTVQGSVLGENHIHTLHFQIVDATKTDLQLAQDWNSNAGAAFRAIFSTADQPLQVIRSQQVGGAQPFRAPAEVAISGSGQNGTRTTNTEPMPPWLAGVVSVRTALAGKSRRGRFYMGGVYEQDQSGGNISTAYATLLDNYNSALNGRYITNAATSGFRWVVFSRKLWEQSPSSPATYNTDVTAFITRSKLGSMKSRRTGSGS